MTNVTNRLHQIVVKICIILCICQQLSQKRWIASCSSMCMPKISPQWIIEIQH
ncbi:MAG: hypothetical protein ACK5AC_11350 [Planctomycetota bacterium]